MQLAKERRGERRDREALLVLRPLAEDLALHGRAVGREPDAQLHVLVGELLGRSVEPGEVRGDERDEPHPAVGRLAGRDDLDGRELLDRRALEERRPRLHEIHESSGELGVGLADRAGKGGRGEEDKQRQHAVTPCGGVGNEQRNSIA